MISPSVLASHNARLQLTRNQHERSTVLCRDNVIAVAELPDDTTAAAMALAVNAPGHLKSYRTTRLLSPQEFLAAQQKAHGAGYQAPAKA